MSITDSPPMMEVYFPPLPLSDEQKGFIRRCVDVLIQLLVVYGFDTNSYQRKAMYNRYIYNAAIVGDPMKYIKWKTAAFYASVKGQPLPPINIPKGMDVGYLLYTGRAYRYLRVLERDSEVFESFATSILYSKKGFPRPTTEMVNKSTIQTYKKLTSKPEYPSPVLLVQWADTDKYHPKVVYDANRNTLSEQLVRTVREVFSSCSYTWLDRIHPFLPSTRANYVSSRDAGGAIGAILRTGLVDKYKTSDFLVRDIELKNYHGDPVLTYDSSPLKNTFAAFYHDLVRLALEEQSIAELLGLPEPAKVRGISKGPPIIYTVLKPLQKTLWSTMKKMDIFKLIGQPVSADFIQERLGAKLKSDQFFLSVDYSDATNEMYTFVSDVMIGELGKVLKLSSDEIGLFKKALIHHTIRMPDHLKYFNDHGENEVVFPDLPQERAQLMGSIMSFPLLCLANAAILRWSKEVSDNRVYTLKDIPCCINGDDAVLRTNVFGLKVWEKIADQAGLKPSIGKVYFSQEFCNMNSASFLYHPEGYEGYQLNRWDKVLGHYKVNRVRYFQHVKFVNLSLLYGLKKDGTENIINPYESLGSRARELLQSAPVGLHSRLLCEYIYLHSDKLKKLNIPWFLPEHVGGLGLPTTGTYVPSNKELRIARMIYDNSEELVIPRRPIVKIWFIWDYVTRRLKELGFRDVGVTNHYIDGARSNSSKEDLQSLLCVESLFRADFQSSLFKANILNKKLIDAQQRKAVLRWVRRLEKLWKVARTGKIPYPEPYKFQFNKGYYPILYERAQTVLDMSQYGLIHRLVEVIPKDVVNYMAEFI